MEALKAAGNDAVRLGDYEAAVDLYKQAIASLDQNQIEELSVLHSNCSFAYLKLGRHEEALNQANKAVALRGNWSKGHFRVAEAQFALRDYVSAEATYVKAAELSPNDTVLKRRITLSREAQSGFYFRQLFPGRDFCVSPSNIIENQIFSSAQEMKNFVYLVGDARTREAVVVDAAWDVKGIRAFAAAENVKLVGAVVTHYHFDHTGGTPPPPFDALGIKVPGIRELAIEDKVPVYVNKHDASIIEASNGVPGDTITELDVIPRPVLMAWIRWRVGRKWDHDSATISVGSVKLHFIHTPGHTPGSQCIHIPRATNDLLLSGDTLFISSCGRLDLPDCDAKAMYTSLQKKLSSLPDSTRVYPGHDYGGSYTTIGQEKRNGLLRPMSDKDWLKMHHRL